MEISKQVLLAGMRQLSQKYKGKGADSITVQIMNGNPVFLMHGSTQKPPAGLPGSIAVPDVYKRKAVVPIMWAPTKTSFLGETPVNKSTPPMANPDNIDIHAFMWNGFTPIDRRDTVTEFFPGDDPDPSVIAGPIPSSDTLALRVAVDATGDWGWWTKPFDVSGCLCCTLYAFPTLIFSYLVPPDYALYVDAWSFIVDSALPVGETFNVRFLRDGETLLEYNEVIADPTNPDPSKRCVFSGSSEQVQHAYLRIDRNQTLSVIITPLGLFPFVKTAADTYCATLCILLHGHLEALLDNRDGAPRPKDVGRLRDDANGDGEVKNVTVEDVTQLLAWLDGGSANAKPAQDVGNNTAGAMVLEPSTTAVPSTVADSSGSSTVPGSSVSPPVIASSGPATVAAPAPASSKAAWWIAAATAAAAAMGDDVSGSSVSRSPLDP